MHILIIASQKSIHTVKWANKLSEKGYQISVLTMHSKRDAFDSKVKVIQLPFKNPYGYILNILRVRKIIRELNPDIVHSFYAFGHSFLARMSGFKPHVISVMGSDIYDDTTNFVYRNIIVNNIKRADVVCSTSFIMKEKIKAVTGISKEIYVTPFGVDIEKFKPKKKRRDSTYDYIIGTVKWMEDKYGIDTLLKAFALFCDKYPDKNFKLYLIGGGSKSKELENLAKKLKIYDNCDFVGSVLHEEIPDWLHKFDLFGALSRLDSESFGVSIIEACACELPVVVSNSGGLPEVVEAEKTGKVVPKENPQKAFEAIDFMFRNREIAAEMGKNGRKRVQDLYDWNNSAIQMEKIYNSIIR